MAPRRIEDVYQSSHPYCDHCHSSESSLAWGDQLQKGVAIYCALMLLKEGVPMSSVAEKSWIYICDRICTNLKARNKEGRKELQHQKQSHISYMASSSTQAILHDVIDIDNDDDSADLVLIGEKSGKSYKGKTIEAVHDDYGHVMDMFNEIFYLSVLEKSGPRSGVESSDGYTSVAQNLINVDGHGSDQSCDGDDGHLLHGVIHCKRVWPFALH